MTFAEFESFIAEQDRLFLEKTQQQTEKEKVFARTIKISEEFGELCDEVLAHFGNQRSGKMHDRSHKKVADEFADVFITLALLAKSLDINLLESAQRKIEIIRNKHNQELRT